MSQPRTDRHGRSVCRRHFQVLSGLAALSALALCTAGNAGAVVVVKTGYLSADQENPPTVSVGIGGATFIIDTDANTLSYEISFGGLTSAETAAHIHGPAAPGANAGVLQALPLGNPKIGVWVYPEAREADILAGRTYVNIHTMTNGGGEIRSQIDDSFAALDGAQETPAVVTAGTGVGVFHVDTTTNQVSYFIRFANLTGAETAAHIHGMALHGTPAGVLVALPAGNPKVGVWNYAETQEEGILTGQTYVNIHSTFAGGGEIRGQIVPIVVPMDAAQEVPPNASTGCGMGMVSFDPNASSLSYYIWSTGLSSAETAAHIHGYANRGANAGVVHALPGGAKKLGLWNFGIANQAAVFGGRTYMNIHTMNFGGGEVRGQIEGFYHLVAADVPDGEIPGGVRLVQSVPNPFHSETSIRFTVQQAGPVSITVYDSQGRVVRSVADETFTAGSHAVLWDGLDASGRAAPSGVYHYVVQSQRSRDAGPITLLR